MKARGAGYSEANPDYSRRTELADLSPVHDGMGTSSTTARCICAPRVRRHEIERFTRPGH